MNQANIDLIRRWFEEVWNERRTETIYELLPPDGLSFMTNGDFVGPEAFHQYHSATTAAFPDIQMNVDETISHGEAVAARWTATGTHTGDGLGIEPTGKTITMSGMTWLHIQEGKIIEGWDAWNQGGLMQQLIN